MPAVSISPDDLKPYRPDIPPDQAQAMIDDAMAYAAFIAPCILDPRFEYADAAEAIIKQAICDWYDTGTGSVTSQTAGPFGVTIDTRARKNGFFTEKQEEQLKAMCSAGSGTVSGGGSAWGYDTIPTTVQQQHAEICCKTFNEPHCSCGANLTKTGQPLWDGYAS
jgi:hypothetical protein